MDDSPAERDRKAERIIEDRVRRETVVDGRLDEHDRRLDAINGSVKRTGQELAGVKGEVTKLTEAIERREAVSKALADAAADLAEKQVTVRQFFLGLAGAVAAIGTLLVTALAVGGVI